MTDDIRNAKCAHCNVELVSIQDKDRFECPECGIGDTRAQVIEEIGRYFKDESARHLQKAMEKVAGNSKFITYKRGYVPANNHRFKVDLNLS